MVIYEIVQCMEITFKKSVTVGRFATKSSRDPKFKIAMKF